MMNVLYEDNHLLVVVKPAGTLAQADETGDDDLLTQGKAYVKEKYNKPGNVYLGLVHRLDRPASGVTVLARTSKAADRLSRAFRERKVSKHYLALVEGRMVGEGEAVDYLVKDSEARRVSVVRASHPGAKKARLRWRALAVEGQRTLVEVDLLTGRPHQIRVQLATLGHPLAGDLKYGAREEFDGRNLALHAYALALPHPTLKETMRFTAPPPPTWRGPFDAAIKQQVREEG